MVENLVPLDVYRSFKYVGFRVRDVLPTEVFNYRDSLHTVYLLPGVVTGSVSVPSYLEQLFYHVVEEVVYN